MQQQIYDQAPDNTPDVQDTDNIGVSQGTSPDSTRVMPNTNQGAVLTINKAQPMQPEAVPQSSGMIDSFIKKEKGNEAKSPSLTVSFSVIPKGSELKGIALMEAVIKACESCGADIANLSIRKDDVK